MNFFMGLPFEEVAVRLGLATVFGMILGLEREVRNKPAGLRTHMLVALSSATTTVVALEIMISMEKAGQGIDPLRVIQGLAQAIGFISAGVIIQTRGDVQGVTTAVNIWLAGTIGIACGAGFHIVAGLSLVLALVVLIAFRMVENLVFRYPRD